MYESFYRLREKPFSLAPDPAFLYMAKRHRNALTMLEYVLAEASGFALITGEVGCGKTTARVTPRSIAIMAEVRSRPGCAP